jgi:hypothetical protein
VQEAAVTNGTAVPAARTVLGVTVAIKQRRSQQRYTHPGKQLARISSLHCTCLRVSTNRLAQKRECQNAFYREDGGNQLLSGAGKFIQDSMGSYPIRQQELTFRRGI